MEQVVLLDESGRSLGTANKATVHHDSTPLHLAFSCYVFNRRDEVLLTRRALTKKTWPGVWTNSCCGHPAPGEPLTSAVRRRLHDELQLPVERVDLILPAFRYRAVMANGVTENEMCPVFRAITDADPLPEPTEVDSTRWVDWRRFTEQVAVGANDVSPWCQQQLDQLMVLGPDPGAWPTGRETELPAAARVSAGW